MIIKVVDFETLSRHYTKYQEGILEIGKIKSGFIERLLPLKKEMESIISLANTGATIEDSKQKEFQEMQANAMEIDNDYKFEMRKMNDELSKSVYSELSSIISEWGDINTADMIIGSTEVVYLSKKHYITDEIIDILKSKKLYSE
jgi:Skp family chaperone for outer membrane proteins